MVGYVNFVYNCSSMISEINFKTAEMDFAKLYHEAEHFLKKIINEHHIFGLSSFLQPEISTYLRLEDSDLNILSIKKINNVIMHMIMA